MAIAYSDVGTVLAKKNLEGKFEKWVSITEAPSPIGDTEKLEVTELDSEIKQYIQGRVDSASPTYKFNYTKEKYAKVLAEDGKENEFLLILPEKTGYKMTATSKVKVDDIGRNKEVTASVTLTISACEYVSDITSLLA